MRMTLRVVLIGVLLGAAVVAWGAGLNPSQAPAGAVPGKGEQPPAGNGGPSPAAPSGRGELLPSKDGGPSPAAHPNDKTYEQLDLLVDVLNYVQENYVDEPDTRQLIYGAASGMVRTLDPFSQFMEPGAHREIKAETEGRFGGVGIRLILQDDWLTVLTPLPGTPAYRLGLLPNDRIIEIDGETTRDLKVADAMEKLRGAPGTKVKVTVLRWPQGDTSVSSGKGERPPLPGEENGRSIGATDPGAAPSKDGGPLPSDESGVRKEYAITRENIKIESVRYRKLESRVGYLRIAEFSARTTEDFHDAMRALSKDGLAGLILDLRFNPGGLLTAAVDVASSFLGGDKLIVYTQGRRRDGRQEFRSGAQAPYQDLPLVVLVNEGSASGAEIIAGALQDHRRALLMGGRTYGKASVQSVIPLPDKSALRLTVARYYTPNGRSIQRDDKKKTGGIIPDITVQVPREMDDKLFAQWEMIYEPGKKPRSAAKKDEIVRDEVLERAAEIIKARDALGRLKGKDT